MTLKPFAYLVEVLFFRFPTSMIVYKDAVALIDIVMNFFIKRILHTPNGAFSNRFDEHSVIRIQEDNIRIPKFFQSSLMPYPSVVYGNWFIIIDCSGNQIRFFQSADRPVLAMKNIQKLL